jgi:uncharacterized protein YcbX
VLLHGSVEGLDRIDGATVDLVAADVLDERVWAESVPAEEQRRRTADAAPPTEAAPVRIVTAQDPELADRIAMLEERLDEQEAAIRRVLTLMIDWVEREEPVGQRYGTH